MASIHGDPVPESAVRYEIFSIEASTTAPPLKVGLKPVGLAADPLSTQHVAGAQALLIQSWLTEDTTHSIVLYKRKLHLAEELHGVHCFA